MITVESFRMRFPEFSEETEYPSSRIEMFIEDSSVDMGTNETRWQGKYDYAQAYLVAHLLARGTASEAGTGQPAAAAGPISSKSAGGVSVTRAVMVKDRSDGDDYYMGTAYGQRFIVVRNQCFAPVLSTGMVQ